MVSESVCDLCQSIRQERFLVGGDYLSNKNYSLVKCLNCGLVYTYPRPRKKELESSYQLEGYQENGRIFRSLIEGLEALVRKNRANQLTSFKKNGTVLDVGCGRGLFLKFAADLGYDAWGTESLWRRLSSSSLKKVKIIFKNLKDCHFPDQFFDVVTFWHSLEHLPSPSRSLEETKRILKKDGLLILEVPNIDSLSARVFGKHWLHLDLPRHLYHFSPSTLKAFLESHGFKIVRVQRLSLRHDPYSFVQSTLNVLWGQKHNLLFEILKKEKTHRFRENIFPSLLMVSLAIPLAMISPFFVIIDSVFFGGGTLKVLAKPKR